MFEASMYQKSKVAKDLKLAIRAFMEYVCRIDNDERVALDIVNEYAESAWSDAVDLVNCFGETAAKKSIHPPNATPPRNYGTTTSSFTFREGVKE